MELFPNAVVGVFAGVVILIGWALCRDPDKPAGNDESARGPDLEDPQTERWSVEIGPGGHCPALEDFTNPALGESWVHPLESESCEIDELLPVPKLTAMERAVRRPMPFSLN